VQRATSSAKLRPRRMARSGSGAATMSARSWLIAAVRARTAPSRVLTRTPERLAVSRRARSRLSRLAERFSCRVERVALCTRRPVATRAPADLDYPLTPLTKEGGEASPVRARPPDRPHAPACRASVRPSQQRCVAGVIGDRARLVDTAPRSSLRAAALFARTSASRPASPSLALACRHIRALRALL
jgi:hypothetical protein